MEKKSLMPPSQSGVRLQIKHGFKLSAVCHSVNAVPLFWRLWEKSFGEPRERLKMNIIKGFVVFASTEP